MEPRGTAQIHQEPTRNRDARRTRSLTSMMGIRSRSSAGIRNLICSPQYSVSPALACHSQIPALTLVRRITSVLERRQHALPGRVPRLVGRSSKAQTSTQSPTSQQGSSIFMLVSYLGSADRRWPSQTSSQAVGIDVQTAIRRRSVMVPIKEEKRECLSLTPCDRR